MLNRHLRALPWIIAWCVVGTLGCSLIARQEYQQLRENFETDARIAHRLLSQRAVQHDAVLAMLMILQPSGDASRPEQFLPAIYPHILHVQRLSGATAHAEPQLRTALEQSRKLKHAVLGEVDFAKGNYQLVLDATPAAYALQINIRGMVPRAEWPMPVDSPVRVSLEYRQQEFVVQPGAMSNHGWRFEFHKHLAAESQPFDLVMMRDMGWGELPWLSMLAWVLGTVVALATLHSMEKQRRARLRAEQLLRFGQVARLNTLGELAGGLAHELNQPLTAILAGSQAAGRMLQEVEPDVTAARAATELVAEQARRAADVIRRLRRAVERPDLASQAEAVSLQDTVNKVLYLLETEIQRLQVEPVLSSPTDTIKVMADAVALEQIVHNLLSNALQALEHGEVLQRRLELDMSTENGTGVLRVHDSGPGISNEDLPHIFQPFFTTRKDGLGLGLNLCETLSANMGGTLQAANHASGGALFILRLPMAGQT